MAIKLIKNILKEYKINAKFIIKAWSMTRTPSLSKSFFHPNSGLRWFFFFFSKCQPILFEAAVLEEHYINKKLLIEKTVDLWFYNDFLAPTKGFWLEEYDQSAGLKGCRCAKLFLSLY